MVETDLNGILAGYEKQLRDASNISDLGKRRDYINDVLKAYQTDANLRDYSWTGLSRVSPGLKKVADLERKLYDARFNAYSESKIKEEKPNRIELILDKIENSRYLKVFYAAGAREDQSHRANLPDKYRNVIFRAS